MISDPIQIAKLKQDILELRSDIYPPTNLTTIDGLPIYLGEKLHVEKYLEKWLHLYNRAMELSHPFDDPIDLTKTNEIHLPVHYNLPVFAKNVTRMIINKTLAKESITFRSSAALFEKCGSFKDEEIQSIYDYFEEDEDNVLVGHRPYNDIRAYIFYAGDNDRHRTRFYNSGLIIGFPAGWKTIEILDNRNNVRKQRSDAYTNPIANNNTWNIFKKYK
ncbi:hypothetical protein [Acinetobacter sp. YH01009]|uniref:hypothetical protein n=1 Tax=Acinetobacter sp. YH01009 TaxID=2601025 RepID=UPI0015D402D7|nr:hypothetical protein [Acinetobacter sp. YH01009]